MKGLFYFGLKAIVALSILLKRRLYEFSFLFLFLKRNSDSSRRMRLPFAFVASFAIVLLKSVLRRNFVKFCFICDKYFGLNFGGKSIEHF